MVLLVDHHSGLKKETCVERYLKDTGIIKATNCSYINVVFVSEEDCQSIIPDLLNQTMDAFRQEFLDDPDATQLTDCILNKLNQSRAAAYQIAIGHAREHYLYRNFTFADNSTIANATVLLATLKYDSFWNCTRN